MEEILSLVKQMQNVGNLEPRIEDLVKRIDKLQQAKKILSEELSEANEHSKSLQMELEKCSVWADLQCLVRYLECSSAEEVNAEKSSLEEIWNEKKGDRKTEEVYLKTSGESILEHIQETQKVMQLHCEETEVKMQRQQKLSIECKQQIEAVTVKIQAEKLKQSEQRMEFEQLLDELMEKHKSLWELYSREKPVADMKESKECLLREEKLLQEKLANIQEELDLLTLPTLSEERKFLKSQEAAAALELFAEENKKAKEYLELASKCNLSLQQKCSRLKAEFEDVDMEDVSFEEN